MDFSTKFANLEQRAAEGLATIKTAAAGPVPNRSHAALHATRGGLQMTRDATRTRCTWQLDGLRTREDRAALALKTGTRRAVQTGCLNVPMGETPPSKTPACWRGLVAGSAKNRLRDSAGGGSLFSWESSRCRDGASQRALIVIS